MERRPHPDDRTYKVIHKDLGECFEITGLWSDNVMKMFAWRHAVANFPEHFEDSTPDDFELQEVQV